MRLTTPKALAAASLVLAQGRKKLQTGGRWCSDVITWALWEQSPVLTCCCMSRVPKKKQQSDSQDLVKT